jgi:pilus assembly protein Flp/PilA
MRLRDTSYVAPCPPLVADERGATAIEYALLAAVVAITAIGGLVALGTETGALYDKIEAISQAIRDVVG